MINSLKSNYSNLNIQNKNLNPIKESNLSKPNSNNLINSVNDKASAVNKILGYGVDKDGYFTSDFNEAAGIPKDYKIYAKGVGNLVNYITNLNFKSFTDIDIAKSIGNAYKVFSQLVDEPNGNFTTEDLSKIPLGFSYDKKSLQVTNIYQTQKDFESALNTDDDLQIYQNYKQLTLSFPSWQEKVPSDYIKKNNDIFASSSHIGKSVYKNDNGTISKGGVLMAFFAGMSGQNPLIEGKTTIAGKLNGYDKNMNQSQVEDLNEFIRQNPINYGITGDIGTDFTNILKLESNISDVDEFKKQWLEMKAKSDAMGEKYKVQIAEQNSNSTQKSNESTQNLEDKKPFKPIQGESQNKETYKDNNISHEFLKKLLKNSFNQAKELEILLGMKMSDEEGELNSFLSQKNLQSVKSVDIKV